MAETLKKTLLLDLETWDLCIDASGNIAIASAPYSAAQDAASAVRVFKGEAYYDNTIGVPYFQEILGLRPPISLVKSDLEAEALTIQGVVEAKSYIQSFKDRRMVGQLQITDINGNLTVIGF